MSGLYDYMTESEYELACIEAVFENQMAHLEHEWNLLMLEHELNLHSIETKILMESGTVDDMAYLYAMEAEEVNGQQGGILTRMINAILGFLRKIKNALFGQEPKPEALPEEVKVDDPSAIKKAWETIKSNPAGAAAALAAIAGGFVLVKNAIVPTWKDMKTIEEEMATKLEAWKSEAEKLEAKKKLTKDEQKRLVDLKEQIDATKGLANKISRSVKALVPGTDENEKLKETAADRKEDEKKSAEEKKEKKTQQKKEKKEAKEQKKEDDLKAEADKAGASAADVETKIKEIDRELASVEEALKESSVLFGDLKNLAPNAKAAAGAKFAAAIKAVGGLSPKAADRVNSSDFASTIMNKSNADIRNSLRKELQQRKADLKVQRKKLAEQLKGAKANAKNAEATATDYHNTRVANS